MWFKLVRYQIPHCYLCSKSKTNMKKWYFEHVTANSYLSFNKKDPVFLTTEDFIELCVQTLSWALPLEKWIPGKNGSDGIVVPDGFWVVQMFLVSFHFAFPFPFCWHSYSMHPSVNVSPILYFLFVPLTIH